MLATPLSFIHPISLIIRRNIASKIMRGSALAQPVLLDPRITQHLGGKSLAGIDRASGNRAGEFVQDGGQTGKHQKLFAPVSAMASVTWTLVTSQLYYALSAAEISRRAPMQPVLPVVCEPHSRGNRRPSAMPSCKQRLAKQ